MMDSGSTEFEWLGDLYKAQCFTTCEISNPAKSSDFGADGFTASLTDWHEILQLTAPDETCGVVFVRGEFPNTPDAILARSQRRDDLGYKGTFGVRLERAVHETDLELGERRNQGWINLRWPHTLYYLKRKDERWDGYSGTYEEISFVRSGTVFQVIRVQWGSGSSLSDYDSTDAQERHTLKIKVGGVIQFGCPCSNGGPPNDDRFKLRVDDGGTRFSCVSDRYDKRLEMQLIINGIQQNLGTSMEGLIEDETIGKVVDMSSWHNIELSVGDPTYIVSTYALRSADDHRNTVDAACFSGLQDHLGVSSTSVNMTDRLWTAICSANYGASEGVESCVIGRCVEQILCVSSIPFPNMATQAHSTTSDELSHTREHILENRKLYGEQYSVSETALISNIMTPQYVDVQSAFFQIRLLVKVYDFLASRHFEPDLLESFRSLDDIRTAYLKKIILFIHSSLVFLVNTDMKPGKLLLALSSERKNVDVGNEPSGRLQQCENNRVHMNIDQSYNQACYATLAVWYVMRHCPLVITDGFKSNILRPKLNRAYESVRKRSSRDREPTPKNDVLQWLHLSCLFLICKEPFGFNADGQAITGFDASEIDRQELLNIQQKFEKYVSRLKTSQIESYSIANEELHRVILLGEELGLGDVPTPFTSSLAASRASHARKSIMERKRTTKFHAGPKQWNGLRMTSNGPWELIATNHQSFLRVADENNVKAARDRLFEFLMSDYSFMTSWDRADSNLIGRWWDLEPASVICATLIDLKIEGKLLSAASEAAVEEMNQSIHDLQASVDAHAEASSSTREPAQIQSIRDILLQMKHNQEESNRDHLIQMRQMLVQDEVGANFDIKAFDWITCKPGLEYHPIWWVQSLQDTPEVYQAKQTKDVPLRKDIRGYLAARERMDIITDPEYTTANISRKMPAEDLQFLSVFDFELTTHFTYRFDEISVQGLLKTSLENDANGTPSVWNGPRIQQKVIPAKQPSNMYSSSDLCTYRDALFSRLNDSLIDLGTKYRIFFSEKCSPSLVGSFIYMWHPDALDTIDSYFGASSRFAESRESLMWTTSITISHWSIRRTSHSKEHIERFKEHRNNGVFPPESIALLGLTKKELNIGGIYKRKDIVEERSSSLVITGDPSGHLWICTIWSSLTDSPSISLPIYSLPIILQRFVHQQACARALVFLILLGHLCEKLAGEYDMILEKLDVIVGLGEKVLLEGLEWGTDEAVDKLKKMLWGLEALRVFDDRLSESLAQIQKAQDAMERTVKQEAGQQHVDLLQEYNNVIEEFEKRNGMLSDVHTRIQLKIRQVTGLRDGISTVTNVEDSQTALRDSKTTIRQGNNIRILTYITIAYLPLGFVTGLFSISHATFMDNVGNVVFAILVVCFVLGTYALALSLESIIDKWQSTKKKMKKGGGKKGTLVNAEDEPSESNPELESGGGWYGMRRRYNRDEERSV